MLLIDLQQHQRGVALNSHQQVIEIMGDSSRQGADCLHLLGFPELDFQLPVFRNILKGQQMVPVRHDHRTKVDGLIAAVLAARVENAFPHSARLGFGHDLLPVKHREFISVCRIGIGFAKPCLPVGQVLQRISENLRKPGVKIIEFLLGIQDGDAQGCAFRQKPETVLAFSDGLLGFNTFRNIPDCRLQHFFAPHFKLAQKNFTGEKGAVCFFVHPVKGTEAVLQGIIDMSKGVGPGFFPGRLKCRRQVRRMLRGKLLLRFTAKNIQSRLIAVHKPLLVEDHDGVLGIFKKIPVFLLRNAQGGLGLMAHLDFPHQFVVRNAQFCLAFLETLLGHRGLAQLDEHVVEISHQGAEIAFHERMNRDVEFPLVDLGGRLTQAVDGPGKVFSHPVGKEKQERAGADKQKQRGLPERPGKGVDRCDQALRHLLEGFLGKPHRLGVFVQITGTGYGQPDAVGRRRIDGHDIHEFCIFLFVEILPVIITTGPLLKAGFFQNGHESGKQAGIIPEILILNFRVKMKTGNPGGQIVNGCIAGNTERLHSQAAKFHRLLQVMQGQITVLGQVDIQLGRNIFGLFPDRGLCHIPYGAVNTHLGLSLNLVNPMVDLIDK